MEITSARRRYHKIYQALRNRPRLSSIPHFSTRTPFCTRSFSTHEYRPLSKPHIQHNFRNHISTSSNRCYCSTPSPNTSSPTPLDGITVIALEQVISAPYCTRHLADSGARVIKIERPGTGDFARLYDTRASGLCSHFAWVNRSKESLALDIKDTKDLEILKRLIRGSDVFIQNLKPGIAARMGLGYEDLRKENERLIVCDISGYGSSGPYTKKKAYDLLIQAEAGLLSITGTEITPSKVGISIADIAAGMYAYSNIMAALMLRQKTGKGCRIDVSMLECMVEWMGFPMFFAYGGKEGPRRRGSDHASIYPYGVFRTGKGEGTVMLGLQNEREWKVFCEGVLEMPELVAEERFNGSTKRSENREALKEFIEEAFKGMTVEEVVEKLDKAEIGNSKVNDMQDVWDHPQLEARNMWTEVETEHGKLKSLLPPGTPSTFQPTMGPIPRVGEHNEKILRELEDCVFARQDRKGKV
ncbi:related to acyl-CoA transferases/carnitine dehydratase [Phialocephala subalpina]|uniref:Related to acyl-CoA transferases/carnitine dehydratase n=1 Tax=Phialocephala subalpina TaxID=576137 RepID=A0A1L7WXT4_9HELO|nr:related to acyl-CoA transferases/carnitine dehydratase [Phialocephala subalpina]